MKRRDFTGDFFKDKKAKKETPEISPRVEEVDVDKDTEDFVSAICAKIAKNNPDSIPLVLDQGGIMLFLLFGDEEDDLVDACLGINILGRQWELVPKEHSDWIIQRHISLITEAFDSMDNITEKNPILSIEEALEILDLNIENFSEIPFEIDDLEGDDCDFFGDDEDDEGDS